MESTMLYQIAIDDRVEAEKGLKHMIYMESRYKTNRKE